MSSIRLSGTSSGYYDLTVPAAAGTNSIDLSNLPVKDSSNNLNITGKLGVGNARTDGTLHVHTASAGTVAASTQADDLVVENSAEGGITIITPDASSARIRFTSPSTNTDVGGATIFYRQNINTMNIGTAVSGGKLQLLSGEGNVSILADASGRVTTPDQPGMNVFANNNNSGAYNNSANNNQFCIWTGVRYNIGNHYNTSNGNFTCPVAGKYFVSFHSNWYNSGAGSWIMIQVYKNSAVQEQWYHATIAGASWMNEAGSTVLDCAANDTIALYKQTQSGSGGGADIGNYSGFVVRLLG